jgi:hypothetical protein
MEGRGPEDEEQAAQRPRVVDKRVSARHDAPAAPPPEPAAAPRPQPPQEPMPPAPEPPSGQPDELWTPEQEAAAQRLAQEVRDTPGTDWVLNAAVTLANVAATKLDAGLAADAQIAIDALSGIVNAVGPRLGDAEGALRQTVAQLQMAYTQGVPPPAQPSG